MSDSPLGGLTSFSQGPGTDPLRSGRGLTMPQKNSYSLFLAHTFLTLGLLSSLPFSWCRGSGPSAETRHQAAL